MRDRSSRAGVLLARADRQIAAARRDVTAGDPTSAVERAVEAVVSVAAAALAVAGPFPDRGEVRREYGARFGRGGELYGAYYRWLLDAWDLGRAIAAGIAAVDDTTADRWLERAEIFRDAAGRLLDRQAPRTERGSPG